MLLNDGAGAFQFYGELDAPRAASCSLLFDFDNDGDLDLGLVDELANILTLSRNTSLHAAAGDLDADGDLDGADVDILVAGIARGDSNLFFDLTGDGLVDTADLNEWRALGGAANLTSGHPYLPGDANLDGLVDGSDFNAWNTHRFTVAPAWTAGDFNADGMVDGSDFGIWNQNKFSSAEDTSTVPEPAGWCLLGCVVMGMRRVAPKISLER